MAKIKVTTPEGRSLPLPSSISTGPGATLHTLTSADVIEVEESDPFVVLALLQGDLVKSTKREPATVRTFLDMTDKRGADEKLSTAVGSSLTKFDADSENMSDVPTKKGI